MFRARLFPAPPQSPARFASFFAFASLFCSFSPAPPPPHPLSLQGSLVSGYFAVKTTTPPSPAGTTPVIRPRLVSRQIRKGSHSPLYHISVLSPFSYRFFLGGPLSVRGFNFKGIGPRSGGKRQVRVFKIKTKFFCPTPLANHSSYKQFVFFLILHV